MRMVKLSVLSRFFGKKKEHGIGGIVPQSSNRMRQGIEFKVEKVYDFKKGGRYFFAITTDKPITCRIYEELKKTLETNNKRIMKELGIISSFIVLDNGIDIKVVPSGEKQSEFVNSYIKHS